MDRKPSAREKTIDRLASELALKAPAGSTWGPKPGQSKEEYWAEIRAMMAENRARAAARAPKR